jgi:ParB-like chromosome segregation protein Spo0J
MMEIHRIQVGAVTVGHRKRDIDEAAVCRLAESMRQIGLQTPITVWASEDGSDVRLVAGAHRLSAAKKLGWEEIDCAVTAMDDIDAQLWEIAENLHRAELSTMERSEQIAEWVRLMDEKARQPAQVAQAVLTDGRKAGPQHQPSGISAAARDLGIDRDKARRAVKIASITAEAKARAIEYGIDTQTALERIAKADDQLAEVERIEDERLERERLKTASHHAKQAEEPEPEPEEPEWTDKEVAELDTLLAAWERCSLPVRRDFINGNWPFVKQILADSGRL